MCTDTFVTGQHTAPAQAVVCADTFEKVSSPVSSTNVRCGLLSQELKAEALKEGALRTFKQQISFGLHVLVMMGTFYVFGHVAGAAISNKVSVVWLHLSPEALSTGCTDTCAYT